MRTSASTNPSPNFDASDIVLTDANGTLGTLTANADGKTWTATFTPTANVNDTTNTISVNLTGLTDTAGNAGVSTASSDQLHREHPVRRHHRTHGHRHAGR
ncbi:Ig-like domain-containing protein [Verminephrobacter aporrectodeae]|uniref:Ig-like domain-containing protein n=1 Tax=Verminephrobacter aporrectodeae TaxID=1110389 RepID=UPI002237F7B4|nr:Ig-like domain-containing protein [Verminephrobacter aporrectodeae]